MMNIDYKTRLLTALLASLVTFSVVAKDSDLAHQEAHSTLFELFFERNSATLSEASKNDIAQVANLMRHDPLARLLIRGYTDSKGSESYNRSLSQARVDSVKNQLTKVEADNTFITALSYGETYATGDNALNQEERKVVLLLFPTINVSKNRANDSPKTHSNANVTETLAETVKPEQANSKESVEVAITTPWHSSGKEWPKPLTARHDFFVHKPVHDLSERMVIDDKQGKIFFKVEKGSLKANVQALMDETLGSQQLVWKAGAHRVFADYWVSGDSMFEVANNLLSPYKKPSQLLLGVFIDGTLSVFYDTDNDFLAVQSKEHWL